MISCGIDFGTSNSVCALSDGQKVSLIAVETRAGQPYDTIPSALFFSKNGDILYGRAGLQAYREREEGRLIRGLKSVLGTALMNERTQINAKAVAFEDILKLFLRQLKNSAENAAGQSIENVIMGRPVHFHDDDAKADQASEDTLRRIAQDIGFKNIHFQYEPVAAAYAHEINLTAEKIALVADFGGGTSDYTVMRLRPPQQQTAAPDRAQDILATGGIRVGGTNFDRRLSLKSFMPPLGLGSTFRDSFNPDKILPIPQQVYYDLSDWPRVNHAHTHKAILQTRKLVNYADEPEKIDALLTIQQDGLGHYYLQEAENAKIALSNQDKYKSHFQESGLDLRLQVKRRELETAIKAETRKIDQTLHECLKQAGVRAQDIDMVILTGGSSQLPLIQDTIMALFPQADMSLENRFASVGLGLGYMARARF